MTDLCLNGLYDPGAVYGPEQTAVLNPEDHHMAMTAIGSWSGYEPTPLISLTGLAASIGVGAVYYKDEAGRFGLGSFKALGGAYAVARLLATQGDPAAVTVCCATDGNHGRSVAWGAQMFGCDCVIFIHAGVSEGRQRAIEKYGAKVIRTTGNYDDSVRQAQHTAAAEGWFVVSDTSYEGYMDVPRDVMAGYTVMAQEAIDQISRDKPPTHMFLQTGVGGMAAAVVARFWQVFGELRPACILVDPDQAACWVASLKAARPTAIGGDLDTMMAGLACGEVSLLAWKILAPAALAAMTVDDQAAADCMVSLADGRFADQAIVAGESAVASLAGLMAAAGDELSRQKLGFNQDSRILLFGTEGDTDPDVYERIVGRAAASVRGL